MTFFHQPYHGPDNSWKTTQPSAEVALQAVYRPRSNRLVVYLDNVNNVTEEVAFSVDSLYVFTFFSTLLGSQMRQDYSPERHWTSVLRTTAGYALSECPGKATATFTIKDDNGAFWAFLMRFGFQRHIKIAKPAIAWDDLFEAFKVCVRKRLEDRYPESGCQTPVAAYALGVTQEAYRNRHSKRFDLLHLFELFSYTQATKKGDKLFALLPLASDAADENAFSPDYHSSFEAVVRRYASRFADRGAGTLESFSFSSWIPCWARGDHPRTISSWHSNDGPFRAAGKTECRARVHPADGTILVLNGVPVNRIVRVGSITHEHRDAIE
ncbi:hypothetical protein OQA88_4400 [Cercophora sp. LCS_1]